MLGDSLVPVGEPRDGKKILVEAKLYVLSILDGTSMLGVKGKICPVRYS